jgi:predicted lipid-binding transport protein (Tim44 family)
VAAEPQAVLARDRGTFWIVMLVFGLVFGLVGVLVGGLMGGLVFGLVGGLGFGLGFGLGVGLVWASSLTAWVRFLIARCGHAVRRHLPWRLMSFLADAHQKRGVLRQAGAVYQFRHVDLQRRLAIRPDP